MHGMSLPVFLGAGPGGRCRPFLIAFTVEGIPFGDRQGIYYGLPDEKPSIHRLIGADPRSFHCTQRRL